MKIPYKNVVPESNHFFLTPMQPVISNNAIKATIPHAIGKITVSDQIKHGIKTPIAAIAVITRFFINVSIAFAFAKASFLVN